MANILLQTAIADTADVTLTFSESAAAALPEPTKKVPG
jgi:hypothetical protein